MSDTNLLNKSSDHGLRVFKAKLTEKDAKEISLHQKEKAFTLAHRARTFFSSNLIKVNRVEKQYYPFWHIAMENYQEYNRDSRYSFEVDPEVRSVYVNDKKFKVSSDQPICFVDATDLCVQHSTKEVVTDATKAKKKNLAKYLKFESRKIKETEELMGKGKVVVPAEKRASFLIRELLKDLIKPIQADKVVVERVEVTLLILYFRPVYSVELIDSVTGKVGILAVDGLTGEFQRGQFFDKELKELISEDILFDVGAELASTVIPGAGALPAIGKEIHKRYAKKKKTKAMKESKAAYEKKK